MKHTTMFLVLGVGLSLALVSGCSDDDSSSSTSTTTSSSSSGTGGGGGEGGGGTGGGGGDETPAPPALGAQIERMGRPAINTALNHVFDPDTTTKGQAKDAYNGASDPSTWSTFAGEFAANLAILDSLDTVCGNQPLAGANVDPTRYATLAGALADDRLWLKSQATTCTIYLAVEADAALGVVNEDCGGRTLGYDVIDQSYSILAAGDLTGSVGDGIPADADTTGTTFPYLAAPH